MPRCPWCDTEFPASTSGGRKKIFCRRSCKDSWNNAARLYGMELERRGMIRLREWYRAWRNGNAS